MTQLYERFLRGTGIEAPQFALLMARDAQGASTQISLGRRYALDKTTVSRNLKLLERRGWIQSIQRSSGRERRFALTGAGR